MPFSFSIDYESTNESDKVKQQKLTRQDADAVIPRKSPVSEHEEQPQRQCHSHSEQ
jgi:hypothetical protein